MSSVGFHHAAAGSKEGLTALGGIVPYQATAHCIHPGRRRGWIKRDYGRAGKPYLIDTQEPRRDCRAGQWRYQKEPPCIIPEGMEIHHEQSTTTLKYLRLPEILAARSLELL